MKLLILLFACLIAISQAYYFDYPPPQHKLSQSDTDIEDDEPQQDAYGNNIIDAFKGCNVNFFEKGNDISIYNLTYGFIQGLYKTDQYPVETGCYQCYRLATTFSRVQKQYHKLMSNENIYLFADWGATYSQYLTSLDVVTVANKANELYDLYKEVQQFSVLTDNLIQNPSTKLVWSQFGDSLDTAYIGQFQNHMVDDGFAVMQFFYSMPGSDCQIVGVKMGAFLRVASGFQLYNTEAGP